MPTFIKTGFWEKAKKGYKEWLNLDEFVAANGGGGGYTYKEVEIDSATLLNPQPVDVPGLGVIGGLGVLLLAPPPLPTQYYEWKMNLEYYVGTVPYDITVGNFMSPIAYYGIYSNLNTDSINGLSYPAQWQIDSRTLRGATSINEILTQCLEPISCSMLALCWGDSSRAVFNNGNGTMKAKIWYKIVNLG